jgi:hypothetical protein
MENGIAQFGMVLIDGSEFTGRAELDEVYGAQYILLDDIGTFKNFENYERMRRDPAYHTLASNPALRNGFAVFERGESNLSAQAALIPAERRPYIPDPSSL